MSSQVKNSLFHFLLNRFLIWVFLFLALGFSYWAGIQKKSEMEVEVPKASVNNRNHYQVKNIPPVFSDEPGIKKVTFPIQNDMDHPVTLADPIRSCSCSDAKLSTKSLEPGQEGELELMVNFHRRSGPQRISCDVIPDKGMPWRFEVLTHVYQRVSFDPPVLNLGEIPLSGSKTFTVFFEQNEPQGEKFPEIKEWEANIPEIAFTIVRTEQEKRLEGIIHQRTQANVKVTPRGRIAGDYYGTVTPILNKEDERLPSSFYVSWRLPSFFEVTPARLFIDNLNSNDPIIFNKISVRHSGGLKLGKAQAKLASPQSGILVNAQMSQDNRFMTIMVEINPMSLKSREVLTNLIVYGERNQTADLLVPITVAMD